MSQAEFTREAKQSILFAVFMADTKGVSPELIVKWLNAMRGAK